MESRLGFGVVMEKAKGDKPRPDCLDAGLAVAAKPQAPLTDRRF